MASVWLSPSSQYKRRSVVSAALTYYFARLVAKTVDIQSCVLFSAVSDISGNMLNVVYDGSIIPFSAAST